MAKNFKVGIIVQGDGKGGIKAVEATRKELRQLAKETKSSTNQAKLMRKAYANAGAAASRGLKTAGVLGGAAAAALTVLVKRSFETADSLGKVADSINTDTEALAGLRMAADLTGLSSSNMDKATQKMVRSVGDARDGVKLAADAFEKLGINLDEFSEKRADEQFALIAEGMAKVENHADKAAISSAIFGRQGVALLNTLDLGPEKLRQITIELEALNVALSREEVAAIEAANDSITRMQTVAQGLGNTIAVQVAPFIDDIATRFYEASLASGGFEQQVLDTMRATGVAIGKVGDVIRGVKVAYMGVDAVVTALGSSVLGVASQIYEGWTRIFEMLIGGVADLADIANRIPGIEIDTSGLRRFEADLAASAAFQQGMQDQLALNAKQKFAELHKEAMKPLPSDAFESWFDEIVASSDKANKEVRKQFDTTGDKVIQVLKDISNEGVSFGELSSGADDIFMSVADAQSDWLNLTGDNWEKFAQQGKNAADDAGKAMQTNLDATALALGSLAGVAEEGSSAYESLTLASQIAGLAAAAYGVANQAGGDPYTAFARMIAMAGSMASLGFNVGASGGGASSEASSSQAGGNITLGSGVLGDATASTAAFKNALEKLVDIARPELELTSQMTKSLRNIEAALTGVTSAFLRIAEMSGDIVDAQLSISGSAGSPQVSLGTVPGEAADIGRLAGLLGGSDEFSQENQANLLLNDPRTAVNLRQIQNGVFDWFGGLQDATVAAVTAIGVTPVIQAALDDAGLGIEDLVQILFDDVIDLGDIDVTGGENLAEVLRTMFDGVGSEVLLFAESLTGVDLLSFQQDGETFTDTFFRIASGIDEAGFYAERFGVALADINSVAPGAADVAGGLLRNSLVDSETTTRTVATGQGQYTTEIVSGIGQLIETFDGSAPEIAEFAQELFDLRHGFIQTGVGVQDVSSAMVRAAGGMDALTEGFDAFISNFFTQAEQAQFLTDDLTASFADLGFELPTTHQGFKDLLASAGPELQGALLALAPGLASLLGPIVDLTAASNSFLQGLGLLPSDFDAALASLNIDPAIFESSSFNLEEWASGLSEADRAALQPFTQDILALIPALDGAANSAYAFDTALGFADGLDPLRTALSLLGLSFDDLETAAQSGLNGLQTFFSGLDEAGRAALSSFTGDILNLIPQAVSESAVAQPRSTAQRAPVSRTRGVDWESIADSMRDFVGSLDSKVLDPAQNFTQSYQDFFRTANAARKKDEAAARALAGIGREAADLALQAADSELDYRRIIGTIQGTVGAVADTLSPAERQVDLLEDQLGVLRTIATHLSVAPGFAAGGIATGPSSGYFTKLHNTEAIIPLNGGGVPVLFKGSGGGGNEAVVARLEALERHLAQMGRVQEEVGSRTVLSLEDINDNLDRINDEGIKTTAAEAA